MSLLRIVAGVVVVIVGYNVYKTMWPAKVGHWNDGKTDGRLADNTTYTDARGRIWTYVPDPAKAGAGNMRSGVLAISIVGLVSRSQIAARADAK